MQARAAARHAGLASVTLSQRPRAWAAQAAAVGEGALSGVHTRLRRLNTSVKQLMCGAVSAIVSRTVLAPLERVKMEVLLNQEIRDWRGAVQHINSKGGAPPCSICLLDLHC